MGQCTTECTLKKFLVHFRRPQDYYGQYGFDWLRQSYVESIVEVPANDSQKPLCIIPDKLKKEYKKDVKNPIAPYGKEYFPAWLSLFAFIPGKNKNVSNMTKSGATLDLYIEALEPLAADDTVLEFICANKFVKISKKSIRLASALTKKIKDYELDGNKTYYHLPKAINIRCEGGCLSGHTEVKVIAKNGNKEMEVGKLMLYDNRIVKRAEIIVISLITNHKNKTVPKLSGYKALIKQRAFNQALVRAEIVKEKTLDLTDSSKYPLFAAWVRPGLPRDGKIFLTQLRSVFNQTSELTQEFGLLDDNGRCTKGSEDKNCLGRTVLFLTTETSSDGGRCSFGKNYSWGDMVVVFGSNLHDAHTYPHELGHSFGLPHTFEPNSSYHKFYQAYTENYMDYSRAVDKNKKIVINQFHARSKPIFTFYKWQWDIMRNDKSMKEEK